jgi:lycopene cyclase domain-containing protein
VREYTVLALGAAVAVVLGERFWLRTGLFRQRAFWLALVIVFGFQCLVDGWLTKLSAPIVVYNRAEFSGWRWPWDIPVEDFAYGFALVAGTMLLWERARD